jgi:phosphatidate cytidylyltransferase
MLVRIVVALLLLPIIPLVLFVAPDWVLAASISLVSALSVWELLGGTRLSPKTRLTAYAALFAAGVPVWAHFRPFLDLSVTNAMPLAAVSALIMLLFAEAVIDHEKVKFTHIAVICTAALIVPLFFSSFIRIGRINAVYLLLPLIASLLSDIFAYFAGMLFGKRKLTPVSPKKTVEGALGGLAGVMIGMILYGIAAQTVFDITLSVPLLLLYGLLGGVAGQLGDLSMSLIKREAGVKDYGNLLPGHGGVLDRLDSVLFAAPVLEVLVILLPAVKVPA